MTRLATDKNIAAFLDMLAQSEGTAGKADDDKSFHDIRDNLQEYNGRLSRIEGQHNLAEAIAEAFSRGV